jgi:MFS transporter, DHA1 family, tetracycline resistance protein
MPAGFWVVWLTVVIDMIGFGIAFPVLGPFARDHFGATGFMVGAIGAAFSLAQFVVAPLLGRLSDRIGRKPVLVMSLVGTAIGSFGTAYAGSAWALLAWRAFDGASGATVGVAQAVVADIAEPQRRAPLLGMIGAAFGIGFTVGPALGSIAAQVGGYRAPFILTGVIAAANAVAAAVRVRETKGLAVAESEASASHFGGSRLASTWREAGLPRLLLMSVVVMLAFSSFEQTYSIFAEDRIGLTPRTIGFSFALVGVVVMIVQGGLIRPVSQRADERRILRVALVGVAAGFALLSVARGWGLLVPAILLLAAGQGFSSPTLSSAVANRIEPTRRGAVLGVQQSWTALARVAGPLAGGWSFDHVSRRAPMVGGAVLFLLAAVLSAGMARAPGPPTGPA